MPRCGVRCTELAVGEPARRRAGLAIIASLALAAVFAAVTVVSKETPALDLRQPWQDDPYDVPVLPGLRRRATAGGHRRPAGAAVPPV